MSRGIVSPAEGWDRPLYRDRFHRKWCQSTGRFL